MKKANRQKTIFSGLNKVQLASIIAATVFVLLVISAVYFIQGTALDEDRKNVKANDSKNAQLEQSDSTLLKSDTLKDADYYFDYQAGSLTLTELEIGDRVVDPSWSWEYRSEDGYENACKDNYVTWIVVAKNHYSNLEPHVTLLSKELIGCYLFDNSTNRGTPMGSNHWGDSGKGNATKGLRTWLNSTGVNDGEGFFQVFSENFKSIVVETELPNKDWQMGESYKSNDRVFIPSTTEMGDTLHTWTYEIGKPYAYFKDAKMPELFADLCDDVKWYWTRSPNRFDSYYVRRFSTRDYKINYANDDSIAVRPVVNVQANAPISAKR